MAYSNSSYHQDVDSWSEHNVTYHLREEIQDPAITMHGQGGDEMLRVAKDGFYVRGEKVPAGDREAETVYLAFKQWLTWANLQQQR